MILTPLGLLAAGTAWGEWSAEDFAKPEMRQEIAAASHDQAAPAAAPEGLAKLSTVWTAPMADYAPTFVSSPAFGYILSAMFGAGADYCIIFVDQLDYKFRQPSPMIEPEIVSNRQINSPPPRKSKRGGFIERSLSSLIHNAERALFAEETARKDGLLQSLDPRVKLVGLLALIIAVTLSRNFFTIIFIFALAILLAIASQIPLRTLAVRAWLSALTFTGTIALPVIFITPGTEIYRLPLVHWTITEQGITSALFLITRVETTVTLSLLLVLCTLWTHVLKALRVLRVPIVFVVILGMTYRYIFVMLETARNMFEARQSRMVGTFDASESRRIAAACIGVLLTKSFHLNSEVYLAMQSRGFRGEVYTLDEFAMRRRDWFALFLLTITAVVAFWLGRQDSVRAILNSAF